MSGTEAPVLVARDGAVGVLTLNRPDKYNCLSAEMWRIMGEALTDFEADRAVRAVLLKANGKNFCTGADLEEILGRRGDAGELETYIRPAHHLLRRFEASRLPIVVAMHGLTLAGGLELMLACDVALAAESARFGDQHGRYGLAPGAGTTQRLPRTVGMRRALDLMFSARWIDARTAEAWGLVNQVVPDAELGAAAGAYAANVAKGNPDGLAFMKRMSRRGASMGLEQGLALEEATVVRELMSDNVAEGLAAFQARREPVFK